MKKIKNNKGITLLALAVTIIVLTILAVSLTASTTSTLELKKYYNIKEDIIALSDECLNYYQSNGELPIVDGETTTFNATNAIQDKNPNDNNTYYQLDEAYINDVPLNNELSNYIINEQSFTIYYKEGFELNHQTHYTVVDSFEGGSLAEDYYTDPNLETISVVTIKNNTRPKENIVNIGDEVRLTMISNYNLIEPPTVTINGLNATVQWGTGLNARYGYATCTMNNVDPSKDGEVINFEISEYIKEGETTDEETISQLTFGNGLIYEAKKRAIIPRLWEETIKTNPDWYNYGDEIINEPKLIGNMTPIIYTGEEQEGNKWANAVTTDGSMFVWVPRYAYKITEGYHTNVAGTIEIKFLDKNNNCLDGSKEKIISDPSKITYTGNSQNEWLIHPAFTLDANRGGGFGEIEGIWVGKFETTGDVDEELTVFPSEKSIRREIINAMYLAGKSAKFGEEEEIDLKSHMLKNSEWGAIEYLTYSTYGANKADISKNITDYTGGNEPSSSEEPPSDQELRIIYETNKTQSSTQNAYGIYDLVGGRSEYVAAYVNNGGDNLITNGGSQEGDLYGATTIERATSTAYKTVYIGVGNDELDYETASSLKGDGVYEISNNHSSLTASWLLTNSHFPDLTFPFFKHNSDQENSCKLFYYGNTEGKDYKYSSFRMGLVI